MKEALLRISAYLSYGSETETLFWPHTTCESLQFFSKKHVDNGFTFSL